MEGATESIEGGFGLGGFPDSLNRVNWAAYFLGFLWAAGYRVWSWALILAVLPLVGMLPRGLGLLDGNPADLFLVAWAFVSSGADALFALKANRLVWGRAAVRHGAQQSGAAPVTIEKYLRNSRQWAGIGAVLFFGLRALGLWSSFSAASATFGWTVASTSVGVLFAFALWLADRRRAQLAVVGSG